MQANHRSMQADWTRREFVRGGACVLALPHLRGSRTNGQDRQGKQIAYVASKPGEKDALGGAVYVFASTGNSDWPVIQKVPSAAPAHLLLAPAQEMLYVLNEVALYEGLPRGTVEAFRINRSNGTLTLADRIPLSLSAICPRHFALSPDGKWLAVAAYGGGIYNLLPLAEDGSPRPPVGIFKEVGSGTHETLQASAHPHTVFFDSSGRHLLFSDLGSDRINVFSFASGKLVRRVQYATGSGSGPGSFVLHPAGFLYTSHDLANRLAWHRFDPSSGAIARATHPRVNDEASAGSLALHPAGRALYTTDRQRRALRVWNVHPLSGEPVHAKDISLGQSQGNRLSVAPDGRTVYVLDHSGGSVIALSAHCETGELSSKARVANVPAPSSIAVHSI